MTLPENEQLIHLPQDDREVVDLTTEQLEDILEASLNDFVEEKPKWHIRSKRECDWAMSKLRRITNEKRLNDEIAEERIREIKEWQQRENAKLARSITFFEHHLTAYHRELFKQDPKFYKSYALPDGKLQNTVGSYSVQIENDVEFLEYVDEHCTEDATLAELIKIEVTPKKTEIAKRCKDGERFPGIKWERSEDTFSVKPKVGE